ncbi:MULTISPECIES: hypothetical protein [Streptomyces]|uniref:Uncharacterized protein n=1 Tax=Streptomyces katrae TaxID=68223 RepID=A0A0F4J186_9ACTN|nr:hypothetical protein [Streptomyces katrae]KJY28045.1 hypothetical protein VR44_26200 [Streptomyces katrae]
MFAYVLSCGGLLYVGPAILLCRKVARKTTVRTGWAMALGLVALPAILLAVGAVIDAHSAT